MGTFKILTVSALCLLLVFCTSNPFFGDNDLLGNATTIRGNITLEDETNFANIFVWLRGFNINTRTDSNGNFQLNLPNPKTLPGGPRAWTGELPLYFYMNNFRIDSTMLTFLNGELYNDQKNLTDKGYLKSTRTLKKLLNIRGWFHRDSMLSDTRLFVTVRIEVEPRGNECQVFTYKDSRDHISAYYIYRADDPLGTFFNVIITNSLSEGEPNIFHPPYWGPIKNKLTGKHRIQLKLPKGKYKVVPFVNVIQPGIPIEMFIKIGAYPDRFNDEYLKMPRTFEAPSLEVYFGPQSFR